MINSEYSTVSNCSTEKNHWGSASTTKMIKRSLSFSFSKIELQFP